MEYEGYSFFLNTESMILILYNSSILYSQDWESVVNFSIEFEIYIRFELSKLKINRLPIIYK